MRISLESIGKGLLIAGLALRYGCLRTGIGILAVSFVAQVLAAILTAYKVAQVKEQMRDIGSFHTH